MNFELLKLQLQPVSNRNVNTSCEVSKVDLMHQDRPNPVTFEKKKSRRGYFLVRNVFDQEINIPQPDRGSRTYLNMISTTERGVKKTKCTNRHGLDRDIATNMSRS